MRGKDPGLIENMNNKMMKIKKDRDKIPVDDVPEVINNDDEKQKGVVQIIMIRLLKVFL